MVGARCILKKMAVKATSQKIYRTFRLQTVNFSLPVSKPSGSNDKSILSLTEYNILSDLAFSFMFLRHGSVSSF